MIRADHVRSITSWSAALVDCCDIAVRERAINRGRGAATIGIGPRRASSILSPLSLLSSESLEIDMIDVSAARSHLSGRLSLLLSCVESAELLLRALVGEDRWACACAYFECRLRPDGSCLWGTTGDRRCDATGSCETSVDERVACPCGGDRT